MIILITWIWYLKWKLFSF